MTPHPKALEAMREAIFDTYLRTGTMKGSERWDAIALAALTAYFDTLEKEGLSREGRAIEYPNGGWGGSAPCENVAVGVDFTVTIIREGK